MITPDKLSAFNGPYTEPLVSRVTGVKKSALAHARRKRLVGGRAFGEGDWFLDARNQVVYSPDGLKKLLGGLGMDAAALDWAAGLVPDKSSAAKTTEKEAPILPPPATLIPTNPKSSRIDTLLAGSGQSVTPTKPAQMLAPIQPAPMDLTVMRVTGPHRITARTPDGERVALSLQRSENFIPGMVIPGCRRGATALWTYTGKMPRRKGKW